MSILFNYLPWNHSSDEHEWFLKSVLRQEPYTDYYVWKDPAGYDKNGNPLPPNNWVNCSVYVCRQWLSQKALGRQKLCDFVYVFFLKYLLGEFITDQIFKCVKASCFKTYFL